MTPTAAATNDGIERLPLAAFTERAYLEYAMYVVLDRALPHIADGLKPVQRRIVYAMSDLGLRGNAKPKKSARTVGDVLGKFHPHGDSACYEAMVLMAQPFSTRYPLIDGQGNWGAPDDPKSFAAMRYTEARLAPYAEVLLAEVEQGTVDWLPNYDGTQREPAQLPARLPNILLNGAMGIAVGMSTDIPPHNLREVVRACIHLLDHPEATLEALCAHIQGPDFPTAAEIITPRGEILALYRSGSGSLRLRAAWERENGDIVITALPHQVSGARVLEQIAAQMQAKKLPLVADLRDESDHEDPTRLVIVPRSGRVDAEALMAHLFATTDLERSLRVNLNVIGLDGRPKVKGLVELLGEWLAFRRATVRRRLAHRLEKVEDRLHVLDGLLIAFLNLDEVIAIIRREEEPAPALVARFGLSPRQAEAILELRLRHLARIEEVRIRAEQQALAAERKTLKATLEQPEKLSALMRRELEGDAEAYGDPRRSPVVARREAQAFARTELVASEPVTVVLSARGWVRAARGHEIDPAALPYKTGDHFLAAARGRSTEPAVFLDTTGRAYSLPALELPSARGQGEPLSGRLALPPQAEMCAVLMGEPEGLLLLSSSAGYGFLVRFADLTGKNRAGKAVLTLPEGARPMAPLPIGDPDGERIVALTRLGRMLVFPAAELPRLPRGKGNKLIHLAPADFAVGADALVHLAAIPRDCQITLHAGRRFLTLRPANIAEFEAPRGRRGKRLPRGLQKVERIVAAPLAQMTLL